MDFDKKLKALVRKNPKEPFEPNYLISGVLVLLNQFHSSNKEMFFGRQRWLRRIHFALYQEHDELYNDKQGS